MSTETNFGRRTHRLRDWDYSSNGAYFVTICALERRALFGDIHDGIMQSNDLGKIVAETWKRLPAHYPYVTLDEWCLMPDHLHGILVLSGERGRRKPVGRLVGTFKTVSTKQINIRRGTTSAVVWQRDFWDHVIRDDEDMNRIRAYIRDKPANRAAEQTS